MADLVRAMEPTPEGLQLEFVRASSYGAGTVSSGKVALSGTLAPADVEGRHVLLVSMSAAPLGQPPALSRPAAVLLCACLRGLHPARATHACDPAPRTPNARRPTLSLLFGLGAGGGRRAAGAPMAGVLCFRCPDRAGPGLTPRPPQTAACTHGCTQPHLRAFTNQRVTFTPAPTPNPLPALLQQNTPAWVPAALIFCLLVSCCLVSAACTPDCRA